MGRRYTEQRRKDVERLVAGRARNPRAERPRHSNYLLGYPRPHFHDPGNLAITKMTFFSKLPQGLEGGIAVNIISGSIGSSDVRDANGTVWENVGRLALAVVPSPTRFVGMTIAQELRSHYDADRIEVPQLMEHVGKGVYVIQTHWNFSADGSKRILATYPAEHFNRRVCTLERLNDASEYPHRYRLTVDL
jgi:hypothetical protein